MSQELHTLRAELDTLREANGKLMSTALQDDRESEWMNNEKHLRSRVVELENTVRTGMLKSSYILVLLLTKYVYFRRKHSKRYPRQVSVGNQSERKGARWASEERYSTTADWGRIWEDQKTNGNIAFGERTFFFENLKSISGWSFVVGRWSSGCKTKTS